MTFRGWTHDAIEFYDGLEADNSKTYFHAHKQIYDECVKGPFLELSAEIEREFGALHVFRPNRDIRFAKDKTPYKTNIGAVTEGEGGSSYYLHVGADGLYIGAGYYHLAADQLVRYRAAVADDAGVELTGRVTATEQAGLVIGGDALKTAPRGYPRDHERIDLLRRKGLIAGRQFAPAKWLATRAALDRITDSWRTCAPLLGWLDRHVGPSELPPEDAW
jgi:uncharacterized protein (TIGR02453 family)